MSLLRECVQGPYTMDRTKDGYKQKLSGAGWTTFARVYVRMDGAFEDDPEGVATAKLLQSSYDHALLLAAVSSGVAKIVYSGMEADGSQSNAVDVYITNGNDGSYYRGFETPLSEFGVPVLNDELREALRAAVLE